MVGLYGQRNSIAAVLVGLGLATASLSGSHTAHADNAPDNAPDAGQPDDSQKAKTADAKASDAKADDAKAKDGKVDKKTVEKKADAKADDGDDKAKTAAKTGGDDGEEKPEKKLGARVPWRGTGFGISADASASAIGLGQDYQGSDFHVASLTFSSTLNYYVYDGDQYSVRITASPSFSVEMTDGATTTRREPQFNDLPVMATLGGISFYSHDELPLAFGAITRAGVILPTSPGSQNDGSIVTTRVGGSLFVTLPMAYEAEHFQSILIFSGLNYNHSFSRATTAVNSDLARPRQDSAGLPFMSDQLSGGRIAAPGSTESIGIFMQESFGDTTWQFFTGFSFSQQFLDGFNPDVCVATDTGCAPVGTPAGQEPQDVRTNYGFFAGLSFFPVPEWGVNLGYGNNTSTNGPDGQRENIFNTPTGSTVSAGMSFSPEALYERLTGPKRTSPFVLF